MSQNPNFNPPRGPRGQANRCPRGQGLGQNSSDPTPSPARQEPIQPTPRHSDPFKYDTQSLSYWDASLPPTSPIPSTPARHPARTYAQIAGDAPNAPEAQVQPTPSQDPPTRSKFTFKMPPKLSQANNPYADIVGDGPYGQNNATYSTSTPAPALAPTEPKAMRTGKKVEFTPYFDPSDTRNDEDLRSKKRVSFGTAVGAKDPARPALSTKDGNAKLRREARDKVMDVVDKCNLGAFQKEKVNTAVPMRPPRTPVKKESAPKTPTAPMKARGILKDVAISRSMEAPVFESKRTNEKERNSLSVIVEAPSPLKLTTKPPNTRFGERTPVLDHILKLRAEEQAKTLAKLEGELGGVSVQEGNTPTKHAKKTSREEKRKGAEFLPNMDLGDSIDWGSSLYELAGKPTAPAKTAVVKAIEEDYVRTHDASSNVYSSDDDDEIAKLTKAVAGLRPFQDLPSSTPNRTSFQRKSAVPEGLDLSKIMAVKEESEELTSKQVPPEKTSDEAMAEVYEALEATEAAARSGDVVEASRNSSKESFATVSSDDYERVGSPAELETEHNGGKKRWFGGFRKG